MFALFQWGFVLAMLLTWLAIALGALMLLLPVNSRAPQAWIGEERRRLPA